MNIDSPSSQRGASLFTALIILTALTLVSLGSLGTSMLELRMSANEESATGAFQSAQAALDAVIKDADANFIVTGNVGNTKCKYWTESTCDSTIASLPPPLSTSNQVKIARTSAQGCPPRTRNAASSCASMNAASFTTTSLFDQSSLGRGKARLLQGYMKLIPVGGQSQSAAPATAANN